MEQQEPGRAVQEQQVRGSGISAGGLEWKDLVSISGAVEAESTGRVRVLDVCGLCGLCVCVCRVVSLN